MVNDFPTKLSRLKKPVWRVLKSYLPRRFPREHYEMVSDYPLRQGKYLRPGLLLLSTAMLGGSQEKAVLLAAAMQASEDWLLIHDDIEDHSEYRRSIASTPRPTLHKLHGEDLAINAGDALHIIMWRILGDAVEKIGGPQGWEVFRKMNDILLTTTEGQALELLWTQKDVVKVKRADYYRMISKKTAYYSIIGPLQLGAMVAGRGNRKTLEALERWGKPLGYAFQIRDDLINLTQSSRVMGKERGGDILEGKRTLMLIHLLEHCSKKESARIAAIYKKDRQDKTETEKNYVIRLMKHYGSLGNAADAIARNCRIARAEFDKFAAGLPDSEAKESLREAISFIENRVY